MNSHFLNGVNFATAFICGGQLAKDRKWGLALATLSTACFWLWQEYDQDTRA